MYGNVVFLPVCVDLFVLCDGVAGVLDSGSSLTAFGVMMSGDVKRESRGKGHITSISSTSLFIYNSPPYSQASFPLHDTSRNDDLDSSQTYARKDCSRIHFRSEGPRLFGPKL